MSEKTTITFQCVFNVQCSYVSMILLITQSELSKPFKPQWMFVFNVIPKGFQDPKDTFSTFLVVWKRALKGTKAAPVCLAQNILCFLDLFQVMVIVRGSEIMGYFYKSTKSITNRFFPQLLSENLLFRRGHYGRLDDELFLIPESLNISFFFSASFCCSLISSMGFSSQLHCWISSSPLLPPLLAGGGSPFQRTVSLLEFQVFVIVTPLYITRSLGAPLGPDF